MIGEVTLSSGAKAAVLRRRAAGAAAAGGLSRRRRADRRRGDAPRRRGGRRPGDGGDPARLRGDRGARAATAWSASSSARSARSTACSAGSRARSSPGRRCLVVEDTVTTGGSTVAAIERMREEGLEIVGGLCVVDRLAGGAEAIAEAIGRPVRGADDDRRHLPGAPRPLAPHRAAAGCAAVATDALRRARVLGRGARCLRVRLAITTAVNVATRSRRRTITETRWSTPSRGRPRRPAPRPRRSDARTAAARRARQPSS